MSTLKALVLNCTLKPAPTASSSEVLGNELLDAMKEHDVSGEMVRVVDEQVRFGVQVDEGDGDGWPSIRAKMLDADILVIATPIWMGQPSAVCKMVLERLDAELAETDDAAGPVTLICACVTSAPNMRDVDPSSTNVAPWCSVTA